MIAITRVRKVILKIKWNYIVCKMVMRAAHRISLFFNGLSVPPYLVLWAHSLQTHKVLIALGWRFPLILTSNIMRSINNIITKGLRGASSGLSRSRLLLSTLLYTVYDISRKIGVHNFKGFSLLLCKGEYLARVQMIF